MNRELREMREKKIVVFTDLNAWKEAHKLVVSIYKLTRNFPSSELYGSTNQMRRSALSVTSNIAEGFSRQSYREKVHYYSTSLGSLTELQNQLLVARDVGHLSIAAYTDIETLTIVVHKLINGLIKTSKAIIHNS
ncbi:MAG: four helix bundle protein [Candidatus Kerfeldbacteria bacterium]|nr:four helix bundle protein [Candidatus Kerfeldbacteria bacterium]